MKKKRSADDSSELLKKFRPQTDADLTDIQLAHKAAPISEAFHGRLPTAVELQNVTEELGVELATAFFQRVVLDSNAHGPFNRRLRQYDLSQEHRSEIAKTFEIAFVASNLPQSRRKWGDHVETWRKWARELGFTTDDIQTRPRLSITENARLVQEHLLKFPHPRRILVTYGQGAVEFRLLLERRIRIGNFGRDAALHSVAAWINVCGSVAGAGSSEILSAGTFQKKISQLSLFLQGRSPKIYLQTSSACKLWGRPLMPPADLFVTNVIGLPMKWQLPLGFRRPYEEMGQLSPNDGAVTTGQSLVHPGVVVPISGMNHRAGDILLKPVLQRVFSMVMQVVAERKTVNLTLHQSSENEHVT
jgi:hypothetical protein